MAVSELLMDGGKLMLLGMGIVFAFLLVLVVVMHGMSRLAQAIGDAQPQIASGPKAAPATGDTDENIVAVVSAAISRYRASHKK